MNIPRVLLRLLLAVAIVILVCGLLLFALRLYVRAQYPYGESHCCLKALGFALMEYARKHDGRYPTGAGCPEASLSLLYREGLADPNTLRGKTVPEETVRSILDRGELLGPDSCGWHYVEGLTDADDGRIAIVWDKVGLDHNGRDLKGGHSVSLLGCEERIVPAAEWPRFLEEQEELMAERSENAKKGIPALAAKIRLPSGLIVDHYDGPYTLETMMNDAPRTSSGDKLEASKLRWWHLGKGDTGDRTLSLTLSGEVPMTSKPVNVHIENGVASPDSIVFEMQAE